MVDKEYTRSYEWLDYATKWTPGGSQTGSKAPGRCGPLGDYPLFLDQAKGSYVFDLDGHRYIDLIASLAAIGLGHGDSFVRSAVGAALNRGPLLSLPTPLEAMAAEKLCRLTGWAEQARWVKTGSEATEAAVRIARIATGRDQIMTVRGGYHAWHSWFQAVKPSHPGVPAAMEGLVRGIDYGVVDHRDLATKRYAAVILEPAPITGADTAAAHAFLTDIKQSCHDAGTLLIFDEVVWGFRLTVPGGTGLFGVIPDLACYGKALGNGVPVGAVVGSRDLMRHAEYISGTFGGDQLGLAAAYAVMQRYEDSPIIDTMWERGIEFQDAINQLSLSHGTITCTGFPVHPVVELHIEAEVDPSSGATVDQTAMSYLLQRLAHYGVLWHPAGGNIMGCLSAADITVSVRAFASALQDLDKAAGEGVLQLSGTSQPHRQAFARAR